MHGPSVYPPQPDSVSELAYGGAKWAVSKGEDRYRRSLYTFAKRTAPFAAYLTFDGPTGESCIPRRERSNTPLQALTLLNDEMFGEAARALAGQAMAAGDDQPALVVREMFRRTLTRKPGDDEIADLVSFFQSQRARLQAGDIAAAEIADESSQSPSTALAAWTMVARVLLNLDEFVTKG